ncbi:MAG: hypothetical protein JRG74_13710 [Deltaproteobacteria bacterium]|nr:hypothetical protein [Deltaproteobacteria bacterium]
MNIKENGQKKPKEYKTKLYGTNRFTTAQKRLKNIEKKISPYTNRKGVFYIQPSSEWCDESCIDNGV